MTRVAKDNLIAELIGRAMTYERTCQNDFDAQTAVVLRKAAKALGYRQDPTSPTAPFTRRSTV